MRAVDFLRLFALSLSKGSGRAWFDKLTTNGTL
jgi:hypothetical protein